MAGYYKPASHELVNIKYCPIQPSYCDKIIDFIRQAAQDCGISGYNEKKHAGDLRHVVIRTSAYNKKNLVILVINSTKVFDKLKKLVSRIYNELDNIAGVGVNFNPQKTNLILGKETQILEGESFVEETFGGSLPAFIAAFSKRKKLSEKEIAGIRALIESYEEN